MTRFVLLLTGITGSLAQEARQLLTAEPLENGLAASQDCEMPCWKTDGFCTFCGSGNSCCALDGSSTKAECIGVKFLGIAAEILGHRCVKSAFLPGETPTNTNFPSDITTAHKAECTNYMSQAGCGWTNQFSCPGQPAGNNGAAVDSRDANDVAFRCCCNYGLWKEAGVDRPAELPIGAGVDQAQCAREIKKDGCAWTAKYNCPYQKLGSAGEASDDNSISYDCCCKAGMWKTNGVDWATAGNAVAPVDPNAFNVDTPMDTTANAQSGTTALISNDQDNGFATSYAAGVQHGTNVNVRDGSVLEHKGPNIHTQTIQAVDASFSGGGPHHGAIHNKISLNDPTSKKERCEFGLCTGAFAGSDPGNTNALPETQHGIPVIGATENKPQVLPSIIASMGNGDSTPQLLTVTGAVSQSTPMAGGGVMATAAAPAAPAVGVVAVAAPVAKPAVMARQSASPVETKLTAATVPGTTVLQVTSDAGFVIGDQVLIGSTERKTVVATAAATARRLAAGASITVDTPVTGTYPVGTAVQKVPAAVAGAAPPTATGSSLEGSSARFSGSSSLSTSSNGAGIWITLAVIVCLCLGGGGLVAFLIMQKANKKKRAAGDREAYLKNDFIERQPVYHEVPGQPIENEPMMSKKDSNYENQASEYGQFPPMAPTQSFPVQVELAPLVQVQGADPMAVTFPGLPPLGTGGASLLQQTIAAPASAPQYFAQPQAASMNMGGAMPYGNYTTNSTYINAGSMYQQAGMQMPQLGQTTTVQMQPQQYATGGVI